MNFNNAYTAMLPQDQGTHLSIIIVSTSPPCSDKPVLITLIMGNVQ